MGAERYVDTEIHGQRSARSVEREIAALAGRQHGLVARRQLKELDLEKGAIDHRVKVGRLHVVERGVYAVGHRVLSQRGHWMAAVLAGGEGARLSHRAAAALWGVRQSTRVKTEITVAHSLRVRPGIHPHRAKLRPDEVTVVDGIPVTTVPRTLFDLAAVLPKHRVERAVHEAEVQRLTDPLSLRDLLDRYPRRRGTAAMREILEAMTLGVNKTRSELEDRFLPLIARTGLPRPATNVEIEDEEVDCVWKKQRLIVELDSRGVHGTMRNFESDRLRDRRLQAAGYRVIRITWRQLHDDPGGVVADVASLLGQSASRRRSARAEPLPGSISTRSTASGRNGRAS